MFGIFVIIFVRICKSVTRLNVTTTLCELLHNSFLFFSYNYILLKTDGACYFKVYIGLIQNGPKTCQQVLSSLRQILADFHICFADTEINLQ